MSSKPKTTTVTISRVVEFRVAKRAFERAYVEQVLEAAEGNVSRAAELAGKERKDFYDLMRRSGAKRPK